MSNRRGNIQNLRRGSEPDEFTGFREHLRKARRRKFECKITLQDLKDIWNRQNGRCVYTGISLVHPHYKNQIDPIYQASLDRIDSSLGYIPSNLQFVCLPMNLAKSSFNDAAMKKFIDLIRDM
ncbi:MAG TPA: hypothetical protein VM577_16650 [Anaerovoracaceae bacterium]|nr:hypothetical protein [Anaerovoracaceae bacterium]